MTPIRSRGWPVRDINHMTTTDKLDRLYQDIRKLVIKFSLFPDYTSFDLTDDLFRLFTEYRKKD